jgi:hypothetical protein
MKPRLDYVYPRPIFGQGIGTNSHMKRCLEQFRPPEGGGLTDFIVGICKAVILASLSYPRS